MLEFNPIFAACNVSCSWDETRVFTEGKHKCSIHLRVWTGSDLIDCFFKSDKIHSTLVKNCSYCFKQKSCKEKLT